MRILLTSVLLGAAIITTVDARSSYMMINDKPVIDLNRKPPPFNFKAPQERRSALFPKRFMKFTVDSDTPRKINTYKTPEVSSESPVDRQINFNRREPIVSKNEYRKISRSTPYLDTSFLKDNIYIKATIDNEPGVLETYKPTEVSPSDFSSSKYIDVGDIASVISGIIEDFNVATEITTEVEEPTKVEENVPDEKDNERNSTPADDKEANNMEKVDSYYSTQETTTKQETYYTEALGLTTESENQYSITEMQTTDEDNSKEIVTEAYDFLNESNRHFREVRSVNIIEEEPNIAATTLPGPKINGQDVLLISFRNINS